MQVNFTLEEMSPNSLMLLGQSLKEEISFTKFCGKTLLCTVRVQQLKGVVVELERRRHDAGEFRNFIKKLPDFLA